MILSHRQVPLGSLMAAGHAVPRVGKVSLIPCIVPAIIDLSLLATLGLLTQVVVG